MAAKIKLTLAQPVMVSCKIPDLCTCIHKEKTKSPLGPGLGSGTRDAGDSLRLASVITVSTWCLLSQQISESPNLSYMDILLRRLWDVGGYRIDLELLRSI